LRDFSYPTLISTKSCIPFEDEYLDLLADMNVSLRVSASGVNSDKRANVDKDCPEFFLMLKNLERASRKGVSTTLRIQPIIPTQEEAVVEMIALASDAGVKHVSLEYLKVPLEIKSELISKLSLILDADLSSEISRIGTYRIGPDLTLATDYKLANMRVFRGLLHAKGMSFGAGDTDLIHLSDGPGCCNGSGMLLTDASVFDANFTGVLKQESASAEIRFDAFLEKWSPHRLVNPYLQAESRKGLQLEGVTDWQSLMAYRWNRGRSIYSPTLFAGVTETGKTDSRGMEIYRYDHPFAGE
jgi:hypothetical protein